MKVLEVVGLMNRGGAEAMLMDVFRQTYDKIDYVFLVNDYKDLLGREGSFDKEILAFGGSIRYIGTQGSIGPREYIRQMKQIVAEEKPDLAHCHLNAKTGFIALAIHKAGVKRIIAHCHANIKFHGTPIQNFINETEVFFQKFLISRYCTDFWGCSVEANRRLYRGKDFKRSVVINNAINCQQYLNVSVREWQSVKESYNLPEGAIVLGNVGRIVSHKNIAFIVDILVVLKHRGITAYLVVAGRNDSKEYVDNMMTDAKQKGVAGQIIFLGERPDIHVVMHTFDVFVGPSLREGFGLVAVEAQAAIVPCVLSNGFPHIVDMSVGLVEFINDFDVSKWCDAIVIAANKTNKADRSYVLGMIRTKGFDAVQNSLNICRMYENQ